ncbi:uncharacterized protein LOC111057504 isoform X1 [Nilaparvata lugens]|uniref:uncharacterized protein LOC111057504 isoform X1 n=1 Tax=Nilaparvata lugens TaxID=108931 RepID=UPI00193D1F59|nr:uncharacterized protein LOC111057504 isoform X1 [Nilaparvata lugens]
MWTDRLASRFSKLWQDRRTHRRDPNLRRTSLAENGMRDSTCSDDKQELSAQEVSDFLQSHPGFLEEWVMEEVEIEQLERWIIRRTQRDKKRGSGNSAGRKTSLSRWKFCVHADKRQMLQDLTVALQQQPSVAHVLWELSGCIASACNADGHRLYLPDGPDGSRLRPYFGQINDG